MSNSQVATHSKPIPALYTVYILRSTVRHASLYIGSTPNPPRRLSQHNGMARGGAARTSRPSLRPWEMVGLVSGFPSMVAALKFEWALANPHLSLHIPASSRISKSTQVKRNGHPRRPPMSLTSIMSNLHLLLDVPSFSRWPLILHFFAPEVFAAWTRWCKAADKPLRKTLPVVTDFAAGKPTTEPSPDTDGEFVGPTQTTPAWGIYALPLDYAPLKEYVAKGKSVFEFEQEGDCVVCQESLASGQGLHVLCNNNGCKGVGHLSCWSRHLLSGSGQDDCPTDILPVAGTCPKCHGEVSWGLMMKELTLRTRGTKDVEKLLEEKKKRGSKPKVTEEGKEEES